MEKISLPQVTLLGIDCVEVSRLQKAFDICEAQIQFGETKLLTSLQTSDPRLVPIEPIRSVETYSEFCIKHVNDFVDTDYVLIAQYDGFVLNPQSWSDEFLEYDYIGAPWFIESEYWFNKFGLPREMKGNWLVGNGGFSLRSKKFLETSAELAQEGVFEKYQPEDLRLCAFERIFLETRGIKFAPVDLAKRFSIEGEHAAYDKQFGFHGLTWTDISKWIDENPQWEIKQTLGQ